MAKHFETDWAGHPPGKVKEMSEIEGEVQKLHDEGFSILSIAIKTGHPINRIISMIEGKDLVEEDEVH